MNLWSTIRLGASQSPTMVRSITLLNPTDLFEDTMIEHEYVECTSSAIKGLILFEKLYPGHRKKEIEHFTANAVHYVEKVQLPDGSWYNFCNYT
ncbi:hypothetical protein Patl1_30983 [Pistacia atlantica]|uniref:Uncharacterized protein n=1 Tax=Pistacia atlantica TaxID=434234 RepID=A0ACC1A9H4_9ROSI|nr:hypothetical protein Patl1_30983 [Pistacia atlantica]